MNDLISDPNYDAKPFVYKQLTDHINKLKQRRKSEDWFDFTLENQYLVAKIKELWYWREDYILGRHSTGRFLQFWRNNGSGHNNIFIEWARNSSDEIVGVKYWSTQGSTNGVGYQVEFFWPGDDSIDPAYFFAARVYEPQYWISFRE